MQSVFNPIDKFHDTCIGIWETGDHDALDTWFQDANLEYNEDHVMMWIDMMNEDYAAYMVKHAEDVNIPDVGEW